MWRWYLCVIFVCLKIKEHLPFLTLMNFKHRNEKFTFDFPVFLVWMLRSHTQEMVSPPAFCKATLSVNFTNYEIILYSWNRLRNLCSFKDTELRSKILELRSHIKFLCNNCNTTYHGNTECLIQVRSYKNLSVSALAGKRVYMTRRSNQLKIIFCSNLCRVDSMIFGFFCD